MNQHKEVKIHLNNIIFYILQFWKQILICAVICALLANGISLIGGKGSKEEKAVLSEREKADAESIAEQYLTLKKQLEELENYRNNSELMKLDSGSVKEIKLYYYLNDTKEEKESLLNLYIGMVINDEVKEKLCSEMEGEIVPTDIDELISVTGLQQNLYVTIIAGTKEKAEMISKIIKNSIPDTTAKISRLAGEHDIELAEETYSENFRQAVYDLQQRNLSNVNAIRNSMNSLSGNMSKEQKEYFDTLLVSGQKETETSSAFAKTEASAWKSYINIKYLMAGGILGMLLVAFRYFIRYIYSNRLMENEEITNYFGLPLLGVLPADRKRTRCLCKKGIIPERQVALNLLAEDIAIYARKADLKKVCLIGTVSDERIGKTFEEIIVMLKKRSVETVHPGMSVLQSPEALQEMSYCDGVVLIEVQTESYRKNIEKEIELCNRYGIPIIGSAVLSKW